jgi:hypothetical protein
LKERVQTVHDDLFQKTPTFRRGDEVTIKLRKDVCFPDGYTGTIRALKYKVRPRYGKEPGWWYVVRGVTDRKMRWMAEVHENCLKR